MTKFYRSACNFLLLAHAVVLTACAHSSAQTSCNTSESGQYINAYLSDKTIQRHRDLVMEQGWRSVSLEAVNLGNGSCGVAGCTVQYLVVENFDSSHPRPGMTHKTITAVVNGVRAPKKIYSVNFADIDVRKK